MNSIFDRPASISGQSNHEDTARTGLGSACFALPNPVASSAIGDADRLLLQGEERSLDAASFRAETELRAAILDQEGIGPGDRVALLGTPCVDWVLDFFAIGWVGATSICLSPQDPMPQSARQITELNARMLIVNKTLQMSWESWAANSQGGPSSEKGRRGLKILPLDFALSSPPDCSRLPERFWPLDEERVIVFTSGTTVRPRPKILNTGQLLFSAFGSAIRLGHDPEDRWLCCLPLHHIGGLSILIRCAFFGTRIILHSSFDPFKVIRSLDSGEASIVSLVPTMLNRILDLRAERPFSSALRVILLGGAPTSERLLERCRRISAPVALTWGTTETASQICTRRPGDLAAGGGVGSFLPFCRVTTGSSDRLVIRGPIAAGGEHESDDLGEVDEKGRVHLKGRSEGVIISGGQKISSIEVESVLDRHGLVEESAVVPGPDLDLGQRGHAFVVLRENLAAPGEDAIRQDILCHCREFLSEYKVPRQIEFVAELPRRECFKIDRRRLSEILMKRCAETSDETDAAEEETEILLERLADAVSNRDLEIPPTLAELREFHAEDLLQVAEEQISTLGEGEEMKTRSGRAALHLLSRTGKQVRALLLLISSQLMGGKLRAGSRQVAIQLAAAGELAHNATLLHDDVIDQGERRRGRAAPRVVYGNKASVLAGDNLLIAALIKVQRYGGAELLQRMLDVLRAMVYGEALQLENEGRSTLDISTYLRIVENKTSALFGWCLSAGGFVAGLDSKGLRLLDRTGFHFGIAFQLADDLLDLIGDPELTGKSPLSDLADGKLTWPIVWALKNNPGLEHSLRSFQCRDQTGKDESQMKEQLLDSIRATDAIGQTAKAVRVEIGKARRVLEELPQCPARMVLLSLMEICSNRAA